MANPPRAATIRGSVAQVEASTGPAVEQFCIPLDYPALFKWVVGDTSTIDHTSVLGSTGGTIGRWKIVAQSPPWLGETIITPGDNKAAEINAAIVDAAQDYANSGETQVVRLVPGQYTIETTVVLRTGVGIVCDGVAVFEPAGSWVPAVGLADSVSNYMLTVQSTYSASDETTTSAAAYENSTTFSTAAAPTEGSWYMLWSTNSQAGYQSLTTGASVVRAEPLRIVDVTGSGPYTVTPDRSLAQTRGTGSGVRAISTMVQKCAVRGVDFRMEGRTFAGGVLIDGAVDVDIDVSGAGASRALVEVRYSRRVTGKVHSRGENNSPFRVESSHECAIESSYQADSALNGYHANGIPRGVYICGASMHNVFTGVVGNCAGAEIKGLCSSEWLANLEHCDLTQRVARDTTLFGSANRIGGVLMNCSNPSSPESEIPYGSTIRCRLTDCVVPDATTNKLQHSVLLVDSVDVVVDLEIVNNGRSPGTSGAYMNGLCVYDTAAYSGLQVNRLITKGVEAALTLYGGGNRVTIDLWEHDPAAATSGGTSLINFGHTVAGSYPVRVRKLVLVDAPSHFIADHSGSSGINHDSLRDIVFDRIEIANGSIYDDCRVCLDVGGLADYAGAQGDVVEICPPRSCTLANATDTFTLAGHDFPDGTPVYLGGTALPAGYTAGTILYVRDSDRASTNTTFKLSATSGGSAFNFTSDGTALVISPSYRATRAPTAGDSFDKGCRVNGTGFGAGVAVPVRHYLTAFGKRKLVRMGAVQVLNGDRIKATAATLTGTVDNASTDPIGIAQGKPSASAGTVQVA